MAVQFTLEVLYSFLMGKNPADSLEGIARNGFFQHVPEIEALIGFGDGKHHKDLWKHTRLVVAQSIPVLHIRLAALFHDTGKPTSFSTSKGKVTFHGHEAKSAKLFDTFSAREGVEEGLRRDTKFLIYNLGMVEEYDSTWTDSAVRRLYKALGRRFDDTLALARADVTTKHDAKRKAHHERIHELKTRALALAALDAIPPALPSGLGEALMKEFNLKPSKELGDLMKWLTEEVQIGHLPRNGEYGLYIKHAVQRKA